MEEEKNKTLPAAARAPRLAEICAVMTAWLQENAMSRADGRHGGSIYDLDLDGSDFSDVGIDGSVDLGELAALLISAERGRCAAATSPPVLVLIFSEIPQREPEVVNGTMIHGPESELLLKNCSDHDALAPTFRIAVGRYTVFSSPHQHIGPRAEVRMVYGVADLERKESLTVTYFGRLRELLDKVFMETDGCQDDGNYLTAGITIEYKDSIGNSFASQMRLRHYPDIFGMPIIEPVAGPARQTVTGG